MDAAAWSVVLSLLALLVALVVGRAQISLQRRVAQIEVDRRSEEVEARKRAEVNAYYGTRDKHGKPQPCLLISNTGPAPAQNINFDPSQLAGSLRVTDRELPIPRLIPGAEPYAFDWAIAPERGNNIFQLTLTWEDDSGPRETECVIKAVR
jgi:hypothetical protein